ncbi:hypothetical protein [Imhoffiella purpurea]|uniref:Transmembrane protein n=1 Tax=Imhoffiella purpurea TaxID=1249627 RepID=W9V4F1_9GAMM|nr:hypothetical protein [Imhoffiella purpurea]EXJ14224.1 hypothetical protein D779_2895 [Imhoffiella purpurea]
MPKRIHPIAGAIALLTILTFWIATVLAETLGDTAAIVAVKTAIPWGLVILVPALAAVGGSGFAIARDRSGGLVAAKRRRMPLIAANGLLILVPCAFLLSFKAQSGTLDTVFYGVQALELIAGAVNIALLGMSLRDGLRLSGRLRTATA